MYGSERTQTSRDLQGVQIPDGTQVTLPEGTPVRIAQQLGDTFTLVTPWGQMVRIEAYDADAIGKEAPEATAEAQAAEGGALEDEIWARLATCYDPEIPVNIVDLGLIYSCELDADDGEGGRVARIKMTLTAPGCGMGQILADDVTRKVEAIPGIVRAEVDLVFDPPWNQEMMTEAARLHLGLF
jgi:probable FeS assembly SUF system protein SufT